MNNLTALVAHPHPIVADALAVLVMAAGCSVTRAGDAAAANTALAAMPDIALVSVGFDCTAAFANGSGASRTIVIGDDLTEAEGIALTAPVEQIAERIAALVGERRAPHAILTPRERDVARLVAAGLRNRVIATELGISEGTVKMHLHNVYAKLGLESRTQLAMATRMFGSS